MPPEDSIEGLAADALPELETSALAAEEQRRQAIQNAQSGDSPVGDIVADFADQGLGLLDGAAAVVGDLLGGAGAAALETAGRVVPAVGDVAAGTGDLVQGAAESAGAVAGAALDAAGALAEAAGPAAAEIAGGAAEVAGAILGAIIEGIGNN